ncbi:MAG: TIM44-like domain-containing protein [Pseudomonadota bacterium]
MKKILPFLTALIIGLSLSMQPAEAKRMGSGSSMGQQKQSFARDAAPPSATASTTSRQPAPATAAPAAGGMSKWMGPLAGLAAGGLLAALFFGGAFEGIQIMDILLIALLAFGIMMVIRTMRAKQAPQPAQHQQYATVGAPFEAAPQPAHAPVSGGFDRARTPLADMPAWFDEHGFLQGARTHFMTLQMAWDANDLNKLREYFTPDMFEQLSAQRAEIGDASNITDVQSLDAQLLDLVREGGVIVASVLFQGRVREDGNLPEDIAEIWHVQHAADSAQGDWLISGIQQADTRVLH